MSGKQSSATTTEISFETKTGEPLVKIQMADVKGDLSKSPEKIKQLMDLLDLPKGTNAVVRVTVASSIVR